MYADYVPAIFTQETVLLGDFYTWLTNKIIDAGWVDISSNVDTDGHVWHSTGESGTKNYMLRMVPPSTTSYWYITCNSVKEYTPGENGESGSGTWIGYGNKGYAYDIGSDITLPMHTVTEPLPADMPLLTYYNINKERIIFTCTQPYGSTTATGRSTINYLGSPICYSTHALDAKSNISTVILSVGNGRVTSLNKYHMYLPTYPTWNDTDTYNSYNTGVRDYTGIFNNSIFLTKTRDGKPMLGDILLSGTAEGVIFAIDSIFTINISSFTWFDEDLISDGVYTYRIVDTRNNSYASYFPRVNTDIFAVRVA